MKDTDKFLVGMVVAVVALVVVAFVVALREPEPEYLPEESGESVQPDVVVHNYLLAFRKSDYERAYGYLSPDLRGYPESLEVFVDDVTGHDWWFDSDERAVAFEVEETEITGDLAVVTVRETRFTERGLFESGQYSDDFDMKLRPHDGVWKLVDGGRYWTRCWESRYGAGCR